MSDYASLSDLSTNRLDHFEQRLVMLFEEKLLGKLTEAEWARYVHILLPDNVNTDKPEQGLPTPASPLHWGGVGCIDFGTPRVQTLVPPCIDFGR